MFLAEKNMGIRPFAIAFFMALVYCRENVLVLSSLFVLSSMIITPTLFNMIFAFTPCVVIILAYFVHYKIKKKIGLFPLSIYTFVSQLPLIILGVGDVYQLINTIISILGAQLFIYCAIVFLYPCLVRGFKYKLRHDEILSFYIIIFVLFMGISFINPYQFSVYYMVGISLLLICKECFYSSTLSLSAIIGLAGAICQNSLFMFSMMVCFAIVVMAFRETNVYITSLATVTTYFVFNYFFGEGIKIISIAPIIAGAVVPMFIPPKFFLQFKNKRYGFDEKYATRTLLNRDRNDVSRRLGELSKVFYEMQDILKSDLNYKKKEYNESYITREVCNMCCENCPYKINCKEIFGDTSYAVQNLVLAAMDNGKVTLLDTPSMLTNQCKRINGLINSTNEVVKRYRKKNEINSSIEQGREMIISQMEGVGYLLEKLGSDIESKLSYDTTKEKKIISQLSNIDVITNDVIIYGKNKIIDKVILIIKEYDSNKKEILEIISTVMGKKMVETYRENNIKGMVTLHFIVAPKFNVFYGEKAVSKDGNSLCGDNLQAIRISENKLMLILSDGMGSGEKAYNTSMNALLMIENFYKAGFDHNTVLSCVGRLLNLREEEEFNALDIVIIDIEKGKADFIKQGGRESFILTRDNIEIIECGSLPLGIVETTPIIEERHISCGDFIILVSDGVMDSLGIDMTRDLLMTAETKNPQILSEMIINNAIRIAEEKDKKDDMSCIVARIVNNE